MEDVLLKEGDVRDKWSEIVAWTVFSVGALVLGGAALEGMVYIPNWLHDMPGSLLTTRAFLAARTPGDFFQLFVPGLLILALVAIAVSWPRKPVRIALILGSLLLVAAEAMTFHLVYPRIGVLLAEDVASRASSELQDAADAFLLWGFWVRLPVMCIAVFGCYLYAARRITLYRASGDPERR